MNLWQKLLVRRGLMDIAGTEDKGGSGGNFPETDDQPSKEQKGTDNPGKDHTHKQSRQGEPEDDYSGLTTEELIAKLAEEKKNSATLLKESMKRKGNEQTLKEKLAAYGDIDPERARKLVAAEVAAEAERQRAEQEDLERRGEFEAVKQQMLEAHQTELTERDSRYSALEGENAALKNQLVELTVGNSFSDSKFLREKVLMTPKKARVIYGSHFEISEDGKVVGYNKPAGEKDRSILVDGSGNPLPFESAIERILRADPEADSLLRSDAKKGARSITEPTIKTTTSGERSTLDKLASGLGKLKK